MKTFNIYLLFSIAIIGSCYIYLRGSVKREEELKFIISQRNRKISEVQYKYRKLEQGDSLRMVINSKKINIPLEIKKLLEEKIDPTKRNVVLRVQQGGCNQCVDGFLKSFSAYKKGDQINLIILAKYTSGFSLQNDLMGFAIKDICIVDNQHEVPFDIGAFSRPYLFEIKKDNLIDNVFFPDYLYQNHIDTYVRCL